MRVSWLVVRPRKVVAGAVLTAALALVALPTLAGSRTPSPERPIEADAFQSVLVTAMRAGATAVDPLDPAYRADGFLSSDATLIEPGVEQAAPPSRSSLRVPTFPAGTVLKPPRYTLSGYATFYDNGTTAMRLPRGTVVIVCGSGGCIERVVTDYGPIKPSRVVDLYRPDFFAICGCPGWAGTTWVTVRVY